MWSRRLRPGRVEGRSIYALTNTLIKPRHVVLAEFQIVDERHSVSFTVSQLSYYFVSAQDAASNVSAALNWHVEKMRLSKDKTELKVNPSLTLAGIPPETFEYRLGNRCASNGWLTSMK